MNPELIAVCIMGIGRLLKMVVDLAVLIEREDLAESANEVLKKAGFPKYQSAVIEKTREIRERFGGTP